MEFGRKIELTRQAVFVFQILLKIQKLFCVSEFEYLIHLQLRRNKRSKFLSFLREDKNV